MNSKLRIPLCWKASSGSEMLEANSGLDLSRPVECAAPAYRPEAFVCSGYVKDANLLRRGLQERRVGEDSGVALAMHAGRAASALPLAAPLMPGLLHTLLYDRKTGGRGQSPMVGHERVRMKSQIAGTDVLRTVLVDVHDNGTASMDTEIYLFNGPRWFVFATDDIAQWVLGAESGPRLAQDSAFRKATRGWREGGALQAFVPDALDKRSASLELTTNARGIYARLRADAPDDSHEVGRLAEALPDGAATKLTVADAAQWLASTNELAKAAEAGTPPPLWLLKRARGLAFGWYPAPSDPLWSRWLVAAEFDEAASAELLADLPRDKVSPWKGLHAVRRGPCVLLSSNADLLAIGLARFDHQNPNLGRTMLGSGQVDGARAAAFLAQLGKGKGLDKQMMVMRGLSALVNVARDLRFELSVRGGVQTLEAQLLPELSLTSSATKVVDVLGAARQKNALTLPTSVPAQWLEHGLVLRFETAGPQAALLSAFPTSARLEASAVDGGAVAVRVLPARPGQPHSVTPETLRDVATSLRVEDEIRPDHERVKKLAHSIAAGSEGTRAKVQAVLAWLSKNIRYELNPSSADALAILEAGRGDCTEYAVLAVSLLRALGIPAQLRSGLMLESNELVAHAWAAYYDGGAFHEFDPTANRLTVHAGYLEASVLDLMALFSLDQVRVTKVSELD